MIRSPLFNFLWGSLLGFALGAALAGGVAIKAARLAIEDAKAGTYSCSRVVSVTDTNGNVYTAVLDYAATGRCEQKWESVNDDVRIEVTIEEKKPSAKPQRVVQ